MKPTLAKVLLIEDDPGDARSIQRLLEQAKGMALELVWVRDLTAGLEQLSRGGVDVVLLDLGLPESSGRDTVQQLLARAAKVPAIVVMAGPDDEEVAALAVQAGAEDYLIKGQVNGEALARSLRYAIERGQAQEALRRVREELEQHVLERTAELKKSNELLEQGILEREQAETKLARSNVELTAIVDNAAVGILFTRNRVIERCNWRGAQIFGYSSPEELIGKPAEVLYPDAESYQRMGREAGPLLGGGHFIYTEWLFKKLDGSPVWINVYGKAVDPSHTDQGTVWIAEDISEAKRIEARLQETLRNMKSIMRDAPLAIAFTRERRMTGYNSRFAEMYGFKGDEGIGLPARVLYRSDEEYAALGRIATPLLSQAQPFETELWMRRQDGSDCWVKLIGHVVNPENTSEDTIWITEDHTAFKQADEALRRLRDELEQRVQARTAELEERLRGEEERLRCVSLATGEAIYEWDVASGRVARSGAYPSSLSPNEPAGTDQSSWAQHIHPDDRERVSASIGRAFGEKQPLWSDEYRLRRADGAYAQVVDRGYIIYDQAGSPARVIGAITDVAGGKRR